jgi:hypothetical protein
MAKRHHHIRRRRHNPFGITGNVVKDAAYVTAGAVGSPFLASRLGQSGWLNVAATAAAAVALSFAGKFVGGASAQEEILKGGISATLIAALKQSGMGSMIGLGSYNNVYFPLPTSSGPYGGVASPFALPAAGAKLSGYNRFRSRYQSKF